MNFISGEQLHPQNIYIKVDYQSHWAKVIRW